MGSSMKRSKKANKKATKGINRAWKKGQSASYNPTFNKYRTEAKKGNIFGNSGGQSNLTEAKLAEFNKLAVDKQCEENEDLMSCGGDSAISAFTNCSLPTFSRLISNWNAGSLLHKEMVAVLAAVSDVLKSQGGKETETEYFAALMTTLDIVDTDEGVTAVICLLSMVVKRLNENVLKVQSDTSCEIFTKLLDKYRDSDHGALLRNLLKIVYAFLKVKSQWSKSTCKKLECLLDFTVHHKPKVRRTAHDIVRSLIVDCLPLSGLHLEHPGCAAVKEFCISKLKNNGGLNASKEVFYILSLLEETLGVLPKSSVKELCQTILSVMTLSTPMVTSACLKALKGLFKMEPKSENLPSDLNARIITALYDFQPNFKEPLSSINWLDLMKAAFMHLKRLDEKLCLGHLPKFFGIAVKYWQNDKDDVLETVTSVLKDLLYQCIYPAGEVFQQCLLDDAVNNPMHKMFNFVEECLSYQYHKAWKHVINVLAVFFEVMGKHCYMVMLKCLQSLAELRDSYKFLHISDLDRAVGMAIRHMGPKIVLQAIPLQINGNSDKPDFPRSWLLPLLRDYIQKTELQFFVKYFMPLAAKLRNKVLLLQQEQKMVESKLYDVICSQIWSLLPGFCNEPTDLKECFKEAAQTLGILLNEEPSLRMPVLSSLRILISKNIEKEENRAEISRFSKNYLPILLNLYSTEPKDKKEEKVRLAVYDTCKVYLQITDKELCKKFFEKALEKLMAESTDFMQQSMIDICRAILPYVDVSHINSIYEYCKPLLKDSNHTTQKKSYSVLNEICNSESESCKMFVKEHLEDIRPMLCGSVSGLNPATRALRLNILANIIEHLSEKEEEFVVSVISEAVLCTKENSIKARAAAFKLLVVIGNAMLKWQTNPKEAIYEYFKILLAGLTGSPHLMSATILAIGRVVYEFKDKMDSDLVHLLIQNTCLLLTSKCREVVVSAISFLKILFSVLDNADLVQHVEFMVKSITSISEDNQRHFRFKAKELLTKLIRKFGYEMISKLVPESYQKQLTHIRKIEARKSRKKDVAANEDDDEEDDDEEDDDELPKKVEASEGFEAILADCDDEMPLETDTEKPAKMSRKNIKMVIEENEDDIVDLLDPTISQKLLSKKPEKITVKTKEEKEEPFPKTEDGRLIIIENYDALKAKQKKENAKRKELLTELGALFKKNKKRKYQESDDGDDDNELGTKKYQESDDGDDDNELSTTSVTKGIHRSLEPKSRKRAPGAEYKAKKAGGDVKRGKFEPYAYVPLNKQILNKRKQVKMKGQFKNLVKGAKKGAMLGAKRKMREARKKKNRR